MSTQPSVDHSDADHGSYKQYITGFVASIVLTLIPFWMVMNGTFSTSVTVAGVVITAVAQLFVQLVFFMHMDSSSKQRWNVLAFLFTVVVVAILVVGSLWIMYHLNYNMMDH